MPIADTLNFLIGRWELKRVIEDHRSHTTGSLTGVAVIDALDAATPSGVITSARYHEQGELRLGPRRARASRSLVCERLAGAALMFRFADGLPFVDLDLTSGRWHSVHDCVADRYEITTTVLSPDVLEERWHVTGPVKDYEAVTTLSRHRERSSAADAQSASGLG